MIDVYGLQILTDRRDSLAATWGVVQDGGEGTVRKGQFPFGLSVGLCCIGVIFSTRMYTVIKIIKRKTNVKLKAQKKKFLPL